MPLNPSALDLTIRIVLTLIAAGAIGYERGASGKAAGLRTTMLVALAACLAMIEVNLLLTTIGKTPESFSQIDPMRLPLGILSGVGFIGGGAILKRGRNLVGVTTAATLWFVTTIGLLLGAGEYLLGGAGALVGFGVVHGIKLLEPQMKRARLARLAVSFDPRSVVGAEVTRAVEAGGFAVMHQSYRREGDIETRRYQLHWRATDTEKEVPEVVKQLAAREGILRVDWEHQGLDDS